MYQKHPFHLVEFSPWPIITSFSLLLLTLGAIFYFYWLDNNQIIILGEIYNILPRYIILLGLITTILSMFLWFKDIIIEGTFQGSHTKKVVKGLKNGFMLFVVSEVMFFFSIFWAYFHNSLSPSILLSSEWPPNGITSFDPWSIPLFNTIILLSSGVTITWTHWSIINGSNKLNTIISLILTIALAIFFTFVQGYEYYNAPFNISDGVYGSVFFFSTGFHGLHVIIGTIFILVCLIRVIKDHFTTSHRVGLESAIIYWRFVDVVWLFLFISVYWWGY